MRKFGLVARQDGDEKFVSDVLHDLADNEVDFTLFFRHLANAQAPSEAGRGRCSPVANLQL